MSAPPARAATTELLDQTNDILVVVANSWGVIDGSTDAIIGTFAVLQLLGFSVNILTMLAFVLAIGVVVDDAIVVLENIYRHIVLGTPPLEAA